MLNQRAVTELALSSDLHSSFMFKDNDVASTCLHVEDYALITAH